MIRPLRKSAPWDSLPLSLTTLAGGAVVPNNATGLSIAADAYIAPCTPVPGEPVNSLLLHDWILCEGFDYFTLVGSISSSGTDAMSVDVIPVSATDPSILLDVVSFGTLAANVGYTRVSCSIPNLFGFYLRFTPTGGNDAYLNIQELQLSKS